MEIFKEIAPLRAFLREKRRQGLQIGFVPTMGALHDGHISLLAHAKAANNITVCSIYVNPTQFNNPEDLQKYPRTYQEDLEKLQQVACDVLFVPENIEMYRKSTFMTLDFGILDKVMEGKYRQGHFSGVGLVVSKLFNIVQPHLAYFGQKDWQQVAIIRQMVLELHFDVQVEVLPTVRESDGLAMSSRNIRLTPQQRKVATIFYTILTETRTRLLRGETLEMAIEAAQTLISKVPEARLDYLELADSETLSPLLTVKESERPILCIAGYIGEIRLIDNLFI